MSTDIKTWQERYKEESVYWGMHSEKTYMEAEIADLRAALAAQYRELSDLVEMQPGGALYQPPAPVGYVFGNSYYEVGNARLTDEIKRLGKARYGEPQAPSAPVAPELAEDWLRQRYGAARGHHAWRDLTEAFNAGAALSVKEAKAANAPVASAVTRLLSPETRFIGATIDHRRYGSGWEKPYRAKLVSNKIPCEFFGDTAEEAAQAVLDHISNHDAETLAYFAAPTPPTTGEA